MVKNRQIILPIMVVAAGLLLLIMFVLKSSGVRVPKLVVGAVFVIGLISSVLYLVRGIKYMREDARKK